MFDSLTTSVSSVLSKFRGKKVVTEKEITDSLSVIREALLKADVSYEVADKFIEEAKGYAIGEERIEGVAADEQFIASVHKTLINLVGSEDKGLKLEPIEKQSVVLLFGLQGAGKTTSAAKLAKYYKDKRRVMLVGLDVHRPAAMEQLRVLAEQVGVQSYIDLKEKKPYKILKKALVVAKKEMCNLIIVDTAGRLEIDDEMMLELRRVQNTVKVHDKILVVDSTIGQSLFDVASAFKEAIGIDGVLLTKFDSDAKGGAALSLKYATGSDVRFIGTGEHLEDLDEFDANRIASRILGMGDIVKLVAKAQEAFTQKEAEEMLKKVIDNNFDFNDFLSQIEASSKMGGLNKIMDMMPGMPANIDKSLIDKQELQIKRFKAIIQSMTKKERLALFPMNNSRKMRIANGSGTNMYEVNQLFKQFDVVRSMLGSKNKMASLMKNMENMGLSMDDLNKLM